MHEAFPNSNSSRDFIAKMVRMEEERFGNTVTVGLKRFEEDLRRMLGKSDTILEIFGDVLSQTKSIELAEQASKEVEEKHKAAFLYTPEYNFAAVVVKNRLPAYVVKYIIRGLSHEVVENADPMLSMYFRFIRSGLENQESQFDEWLARIILNYIDNAGTKEDREFVSRFILENIGNTVPENYLREILLNSKQTELFIRDLDVHFSGIGNLELLNFRDFAKNYDTYGTPRDLIRVYLKEKGIEFGEDEFNQNFDAALQELQKQSGIGKTERKSQIDPIYAELLEKVGPNAFHGYERIQIDGAKVVALLDGNKQIGELSEGQQGTIVLNETPFYAEAGGQVGDTGLIVSAASENADTAAMVRIRVLDTFSPLSGLILHKCKVESGKIEIGDRVDAMVDVEKRDATRRNHTATHLLHAALREVLGSHVKQAGSVVAPNYLRFDFTHYQPLSAEDVIQVEDLVNRYILRNDPVNTNIMAIEEAMSTGAMALFGEKYGSDVRVLSIGDGVFSKELCGGTHVRATGDIGTFKVTGDEAIASGVRRIRAITGFDSLERFREDEQLIVRSLSALKTQRDNLPNAIERLQEELKKTRKEFEELKLKMATGSAGHIIGKWRHGERCFRRAGARQDR